MSFFRKKIQTKNEVIPSNKDAQLSSLQAAVAFLEEQQQQLKQTVGSTPIVDMKNAAAACAANCVSLLLYCIETYSALLSPRIGSLAAVYQKRIDTTIERLLNVLPQCELRFLLLEREIFPLLQALAKNIDDCSKAF